MKKTIVILFFSFTLFLLFPYERFVDFDLVKEPGRPRIVDNGVLFTIPGGKDKAAFIRTSMDNWTNDYYFKTNLYGVMYVYIKFNENTKEFKYRLNVNNYWVDDANNPDYTEDQFGTKLYTIAVPLENRYYNKLPDIEKSDSNIKTVLFRYYNPDASEVNFVFSTDDWSEFTYSMTKDQYGWWSIKKNFTRGKYLYYFLADGKKEVDINNPDKDWDRKKGDVSFLVIE